MQDHDTYQQAATLADLPETGRQAMVDTIGQHFEDSEAVAVGESPTGAAELRVPDPIPAAHRADFVATIESYLTASLDATQRVVLDQRVGWPECRYEICVDYR